MARNMQVSGKTSSDVLSASQLCASDVSVQLYCKPCERDGSRVPAYGFCQDCAEYLCKSCYKNHLKPAPLKNHVLLDSSKMPQSQQLSHLSVPTDLTEICQLHSGKVIYFCRDHNILGCGPCVTINHRTCKIDYIPDASKNYDTSQEYKHLIDSLRNIHTRCKKLAQLAKENKKTIQENQDAIKIEIRKFRQEIDCILDNWETEAVGKVEQLFGEESVRMDYIETKYCLSIKEIEDLQNQLKESQQSGKLNDLFCKAKKNEGTMKDYATAFTLMQENNYISNASFKRNSSLERLFKTEKCLGQFTFEKDETIHIKMPLNSTDSGLKEKMREGEQSDQQEESGDNTKHAPSSILRNVDSQLLQHPLYKHIANPARFKQEASQQPNLTYDNVSVTSCGEIDLRVPGDTEDYSIRGIAVISSALIAVTDFFNQMVKLVDTVQKKVVASLKMPAQPFGVAVLPCDQLAVTFPAPHIIQVLSTTGGLSRVRHVKVDGQCWGLAYSDGHFVVGFTDPGKVQIMTSEGKVLRTIQYDKARFLFNKKLFILPCFVTADENNKTVYVSDCDDKGKGITRLNWEGEVTGVFKDSKLSKPFGTFVMPDGALLVCDYFDHIIQLVSPDFKTSRILLQQNDGLSFWCVAIDREENKLYVGCRHNNLLLYEMK